MVHTLDESARPRCACARDRDESRSLARLYFARLDTIDASALRALDRAILVRVARYCSRSTADVCTASTASLAARVGCDVRTLERHLRHLERAGWLRRDGVTDRGCVVWRLREGLGDGAAPVDRPLPGGRRAVDGCAGDGSAPPDLTPDPEISPEQRAPAPPAHGMIEVVDSERSEFGNETPPIDGLDRGQGFGGAALMVAGDASDPRVKRRLPGRDVEPLLAPAGAHKVDRVAFARRASNGENVRADHAPQPNPSPLAPHVARALAAPSLARVASPALAAQLAAVASELHLDAAQVASALAACAQDAAVAAAGGSPWARPRLLHALAAYLRREGRPRPGLARTEPPAGPALSEAEALECARREQVERDRAREEEARREIARLDAMPRRARVAPAVAAWGAASAAEPRPEVRSRFAPGDVSERAWQAA